MFLALIVIGFAVIFIGGMLLGATLAVQSQHDRDEPRGEWMDPSAEARWQRANAEAKARIVMTGQNVVGK